MREIPATGSNAIISTVEKIFWSFIEIFQSTQNFAHFETKDQLHTLNISQVIDPEKSVYFSARKFFF